MEGGEGPLNPPPKRRTVAQSVNDSKSSNVSKKEFYARLSDLKGEVSGSVFRDTILRVKREREWNESQERIMKEEARRKAQTKATQHVLSDLMALPPVPIVIMWRFAHRYTKKRPWSTVPVPDYSLKSEEDAEDPDDQAEWRLPELGAGWRVVCTPYGDNPKPVGETGNMKRTYVEITSPIVCSRQASREMSDALPRMEEWSNSYQDQACPCGMSIMVSMSGVSFPRVQLLCEKFVASESGFEVAAQLACQYNPISSYSTAQKQFESEVVAGVSKRPPPPYKPSSCRFNTNLHTYPLNEAVERIRATSTVAELKEMMNPGGWQTTRGPYALGLGYLTEPEAQSPPPDAPPRRFGPKWTPPSLPPAFDTAVVWNHHKGSVMFSCVIPWVALVLSFTEHCTHITPHQKRLFRSRTSATFRDLEGVESLCLLFNTTIRSFSLYQLLRNRSSREQRPKFKPTLRSSDPKSGSWNRTGARSMRNHEGGEASEAEWDGEDWGEGEEGDTGEVARGSRQGSPPPKRPSSAPLARRAPLEPTEEGGYPVFSGSDGLLYLADGTPVPPTGHFYLPKEAGGTGPQHAHGGRGTNPNRKRRMQRQTQQSQPQAVQADGRPQWDTRCPVDQLPLTVNAKAAEKGGSLAKRQFESRARKKRMNKVTKLRRAAVDAQYALNLPGPLFEASLSGETSPLAGSLPPSPYHPQNTHPTALSAPWITGGYI